MNRSQFIANWATQARKGSLELVLMSALAGREFYGYELTEHLRSVCGLMVNDGTLYAILVRLKQEGLVQQRWQQSESGPARKYYSLTRSGSAALSEMREIWAEIARAVKRSARGESDV
jgi:PadR family transcriptional regulator PadR